MGYGFGFVTICMTVSALLLAYKSIQSVAQGEGRAVQASDFFSNAIFRDVVLSLAATLGLYIVSSLIFVSCHLSSTPLVIYIDDRQSLNRGI